MKGFCWVGSKADRTNSQKMDLKWSSVWRVKLNENVDGDDDDDGGISIVMILN